MDILSDDYIERRSMRRAYADGASMHLEKMVRRVIQAKGGSAVRTGRGFII